MLAAAIILGAVASTYAAPVAAPFEIERRASAVNYNQNYIAGGANVQYTPNQSAGSFGVTWNTNGDFVVGLGWQTGDAT
jgi:endo-1,4-beta-xylanase